MVGYTAKNVNYGSAYFCDRQNAIIFYEDLQKIGDAKMKTTNESNRSGLCSKYTLLGEYLSCSKQAVITLTFEQISIILRFELPMSAYKYREWWSNGGHIHSRAWLDYGYEVEQVILNSHKVVFHKTGKHLSDKTENIGNSTHTANLISQNADTDSLRKSKTYSNTKYNKLGEYLYRTGQSTVTLTFERIQDIIGFELPKSAYTYRAWWSNGGQSHSVAWLYYGYKVEWVAFSRNEIQFSKTGKSLNTYKSECTNNSHAAETHIDRNSDSIFLCGYEFDYIQDIVPQRDKLGKVIEYAPQNDYTNKDGKRLHYYGSGSFCKFKIAAVNQPGVYIWVVDNQVIYIGETANLTKRFNTGYGNITGVNCYEGGQTTNCKMNKVVLNLSKEEKNVKLYFFKTVNHKEVELELLRNISTKYNIKDNK